MKAELENKSLELLTWLEQTIKTTADFGAEQIPLFVQELLRYHYWTSLSYFILAVLGIIVSLYGSYRFIKWALKNDEGALPFSMFLSIPVVAFVFAAFNNTEWIMIQLAPRLFLLEYVKELIKH